MEKAGKAMKIIFATGNEGKMREIREILRDMDAEILSMKEAGIGIDIEENGSTFEENSEIKASLEYLKLCFNTASQPNKHKKKKLWVDMSADFP